MSHNVLIGLGSNLGNRKEILTGAWSRILAIPEVESGIISSFRETIPVGGPEDQPRFLNAVAQIFTTLAPEPLLDRLQQLENDFARKRLVPWGPRTLDLDLLLFDSEIIHNSRLKVPHPRMFWRAFVLEPAAEIAPDRVIPSSHLTILETLRLFRFNCEKNTVFSIKKDLSLFKKT